MNRQIQILFAALLLALLPMGPAALCGVAPTLDTEVNHQMPLEYETITVNGVTFRMVSV